MILCLGSGLRAQGSGLGLCFADCASVSGVRVSSWNTSVCLHVFVSTQRAGCQAPIRCVEQAAPQLGCRETRSNTSRMGRAERALGRAYLEA